MAATGGSDRRMSSVWRRCGGHWVRLQSFSDNRSALSATRVANCWPAFSVIPPPQLKRCSAHVPGHRGILFPRAQGRRDTVLGTPHRTSVLPDHRPSAQEGPWEGSRTFHSRFLPPAGAAVEPLDMRCRALPRDGRRPLPRGKIGPKAGRTVPRPRECPCR
jgi:hypothetical protein